MWRFPLRLRAELLRARCAQALRGKAKQTLILRLEPDGEANLSVPSGTEHAPTTQSEAELLDMVQASAAPVVWIGGSEPLLHPAIGKLARRIVDCGRTVFLETDGFYLRQRIHEFRPVSRLFLTLKFYGLQLSHDIRAGRAGAFERAVEGMRTAKLSGFLICAHALIDERTNLDEMAQLREQLLGMDADGLLVSAAPGALNAANRERGSLERKLHEARKLIGNRGWEAFSRLMVTGARDKQDTAGRARESGQAAQQAAEVREEGVQGP